MSEARSGPQIVVVGAVTEDRFDDATRPGGAVLYASRALEALRIRSRVLTSAAPPPDVGVLDRNERTFVDAGQSLGFAHHVTSGERTLRLLSSPERALAASDLPDSWRDMDALILGPLLPDDLDVASFVALSIPRIALLAQGLQRRVAADGVVSLLDEPSSALLAACDARTSVFLSNEEVARWPARAVEELTAACARVVLTRGADGADVYRAGLEPLHIAAVPATPVDTTGAGDAFAASFAAALTCGASDEQAGALAARVAAATVEHVGPVRLPPIATPEGAAR
ncbi:MAG: PfkB family carbohydrate kinase [Chloroflexota bacterium]|nr:PfkB family carbohydrate kinase [Chloroflexota bacterium]